MKELIDVAEIVRICRQFSRDFSSFHSCPLQYLSYSSISEVCSLFELYPAAKLIKHRIATIEST